MANEIIGGCLYLTGTPIGNLSDMSERTKKVLSEVDFIAAEDTRVTGKLLQFIGIKKPMVSYHEHNKREKGEYIVSRLLNGESCALVSDAGMPAISDPGEDLVRICAKHGVEVYCVPGPSAVVCAMALSGLSTARFSFEGFLPVEKKDRLNRLKSVSSFEHTLVFYEAPHRLIGTLETMLEVFGDRKISVVKEITKLNEQTFRTTLSNALEYYSGVQPKGEFVIVVEGEQKENVCHFWDMLTIAEHVDYYIKNGLEKMEAFKKVAQERGVSKSSVYKEYNNG